MQTLSSISYRFLHHIVGALLAFGFLTSACAADDTPEAFIKRLSGDVIDAIKADKSLAAGDINKVIVLVDQKVMPSVNFLRMTASAVGPNWRQATPEQQKRLQEEFKTLLVRTYSVRAAPDDKEVVVRTEVRGKGDPIQLDYRVEKATDAPAGWRIYNLNVMGVWLVDNYRSQFAQEINAKGIDGLIASLADRNKTNAGKPAGK